MNGEVSLLLHNRRFSLHTPSGLCVPTHLAGVMCVGGVAVHQSVNESIHLGHYFRHASVCV